MKPRECARKAVDVASEKQASDILLLDIRKVSVFADYFVIMSTESHRQMDALAESLVVAFKGAGTSLHHREGSMNSGWILLDFGEVILHLFYKEVREHYQLEKLWSTGKTVLRVQ
ncbi:MAG: ribosome silencing factor [SAR202 cluster bacterium Io17-Chloro-G3]|nr:MAG: ribosome silencing factor [SAR202 cluster bacterium Io17-Chloro-G3]